MRSNPKLGMYVAITAILFAFSPTVFTNASYSTTDVGTPASNPTPSLLPPGQIMPHVVKHLPTKIYDPNIDCATNLKCVATTDISYADVFVTLGTTLVATVAVCGNGLSITWANIKHQAAWVYSDYGCSELETISASTYSVSTLATGINGAAGITYSAKYKMFYVTQFGYGEVAAVTKSGGVTEITITSAPGCSSGSYPEFDAVASTGVVYVGARYGCAVAINGTQVEYSTTAIYGPAGAAVNLKNGDPYFADAVYGDLYVCTPTLSSCYVVSSFSNGLWGIWYMAYDKSIWVAEANGYITNGSTQVYTGEANDNGCAQAKGPQLTAPGEYYNFIYNIKTMKSQNVTSVSGFSCIYAGGNNN